MGTTVGVALARFDVGDMEPDMDDMDAPVITLEQLRPDMRGAVVLMNDSNLRTLAVESSTMVVGKGVAGPERTLAGDDVDGFHWVRFANGVTLYYPPDLVVAVRVPRT